MGSNLEVTTEHSWKKRLTSNTGSGLYSANYWRAKFALFTDQCISRVGSLEILIKQLAFQNWLHFLNILLPYIRCMPIPAILFHTIANIIFQWSKKVVRGGATKGPLVSWILDVYTLVHNYLVLGYKNENNSGYAWKLPGVNTTSEPIPGNEGNIITNARWPSMITIYYLEFWS